MAEFNVISNTTPSAASVATGKIHQVFDNGEIWIQLDGEAAPKKAQLLTTGYVDLQLYQESTRIFVQQLPGESPIIMGVLQERLPTLSALAEDMQDLSVHADGKRTTIAAKNEVELKCGKGSILLKKNGKVIIKGSEVISRSTGANKIKGASVNIN